MTESWQLLRRLMQQTTPRASQERLVVRARAGAAIAEAVQQADLRAP